MALNKTQKMKRDWRKSKAWKDFRHEMNVRQKGIDPITGRKLTKGSNLHHKILTSDEEVYTDISDPDKYIMLNKTSHDVIHFCLRYVKMTHDMSIIDRLYKEVEAEAILNGFID